MLSGLASLWRFLRTIVGAPADGQLGPYTLEQKIGEGGMGEVYRARHAAQRRPVAVKLLPRASARDPMRARLFAREVQLTRRLRHPNTVAIYDWGRMPDGTLYYAMEYVDGFTLAELVAHEGAQPPARVVQLLRQIAAALEAVHAAGLVHRDIKPANLMTSHRDASTDRITVLDFGLVTEARSPDRGEPPDGRPRTASSDLLMGTPLYIAPEAIENPDDVDGRADLYALGAVGYFLLTGGSTFEGTTTFVEACIKQLYDDPVRPSLRTAQWIPGDLEDLVMACLARDPSARPRNAAEVSARVARIAEALDAAEPVEHAA